jgi:hypothetical protein
MTIARVSKYLQYYTVHASIWPPADPAAKTPFSSLQRQQSRRGLGNYGPEGLGHKWS